MFRCVLTAVGAAFCFSAVCAQPVADSLADFVSAANDGISAKGSPVTPGSSDDAAQHGHADSVGTGTWVYGVGNSGDGSAFGGGFPLLTIWNGAAWINANSPAVVGPSSQAPNGSSLNADPLTYRRWTSGGSHTGDTLRAVLRVTLVNPASDGVTIILNERDSITDIVELISPDMVGVEQTYVREFIDTPGNWVLVAVTPLGIGPPNASNFFNDSVSLRLTIERLGCDIADVNGDGLTSPADFNAWIVAFNNGDPGCDQNGDGLCTPADFNAWIANFNSCD